MYGMTERQFERFFENASRMAGQKGHNFIQLLERRLDNVVYRLGFASSRAQARQLVSHGHITVNGKRLDIPSALVKVGDVIGIASKSRDIPIIKENLEVASARTTPEWLELQAERMEGRVISLPTREQIDVPVNEQLIVEFYAR
jgi:small subunit ribosomal protein S4